VGFQDEQAYLRPRARLMRHLGEELIGSDRVAIIELVKNAYDADARIVVVKFAPPLVEGEGAVEVWDDGHGMSQTTVRDAWMEIATPHRERQPRSESGQRRVLGAKGIGRFAAARLAHVTYLVTRRVDEEEVSLLVDWGDFSDDDAYLDEVPLLWSAGAPKTFVAGGEADQILGRVVPSLGGARNTDPVHAAAGGPTVREDRPAAHDDGAPMQSGQVPTSATGVSPEREPVTHGTLVRLEQLRHGWDAAAIENVRRSLSRLIPPPPPAELDVPDQPEFAIYVEAPEDLHHLSGFVRASEALSHPDYRLVGAIEEDGSAHFAFLTAARETPESIEIPLRRNPPTSCGPLQIDIRVWDLESTSVRRLVELDVGARNITEVRELIRSNSGIALYRDGFRVQPYGEPEYDWLGLGQRRVNNPTMRLSNNQVAGFVYVTAEENPELRDRSNREGLIENPQYEDLKEVMLKAISEIETRRYGIRRGHHGPEEERQRGKGIFDAFDLSGIRDVINTRYAQDAELSRALDEAEEEVNEGIRQVQEVVSRFSRLATLGTLVDVILHEGRTALTRMAYVLRRLDKAVERAVDVEAAAVMRQIGQRFEEQRQALDRLFTQIEPLSGRRRGRPKALSMQAVIRQGLAVIEGEIEHAGAQVDVEGEDTSVTVDAADIIQVVVNLVRNALYWTSTAAEGNQPRISISTSRQPDGAVDITISDNGPGVPDEIRDLVFDAYFSTRPHGVGLGLSIAGSIVKDFYGGELELLAQGPLRGATFRARLRRRTG